MLVILLPAAELTRLVSAPVAVVTRFCSRPAPVCALDAALRRTSPAAVAICAIAGLSRWSPAAQVLFLDLLRLWIRVVLIALVISS